MKERERPMNLLTKQWEMSTRRGRGDERERETEEESKEGEGEKPMKKKKKSKKRKKERKRTPNSRWDLTQKRLFSRGFPSPSLLPHTSSRLSLPHHGLPHLRDGSGHRMERRGESEERDIEGR